MSQDPETSSDLNYYAARAAEERRRAMASTDSNARAAHLELAEKYSKLAEGGGFDPLQMREQRA